MTLKSVNPYTGKTIKTYPQTSPRDIERILHQASEGFELWQKTPPGERADKLKAAGDILRKRKEEFAQLISTEMGKLLKEAEAEVDKSALVCDYYAENGEKYLQDKPIDTEYDVSRVVYRPLGPVLAIMPWNFPFWQVFRFAAPNLMAGNTGILKHAGNVSGCSLAIASVFQEAGFPEGCFASVLLPGKETQPLIEDSRVAAVTLTGSTQAGKKVAEIAGKNLKKVVLELGGSDPYLILDDADVELAADKCAFGRLLNAGQSCIGAKRFLVMESVYDTFLEAFKTKLEAVKPGDPLDKNSTLAPLATTVFRDDLHRQVKESIKAGAKCITGGYITDPEGAFYPATILTDVKPGMPAYDEELFGPVASVIKVASEEEAIKIANDTVFGLGAAVFTKDRDRAVRIAADELHSGCVFINDFVKSDPRMPFGGVKESGYGRELAEEGFREFMNVKTVAGKV
ncbi:MAG TPA: NAD-dependent succinate-semialdehyde dehydrogenase [Bacteroidales bacterium]|nr:NAD-dependent succinate-semialdehyde dehydrogenase [Bacteroidales bacterium]